MTLWKPDIWNTVPADEVRRGVEGPPVHAHVHEGLLLQLHQLAGCHQPQGKTSVSCFLVCLLLIFAFLFALLLKGQFLEILSPLFFLSNCSFRSHYFCSECILIYFANSQRNSTKFWILHCEIQWRIFFGCVGYNTELSSLLLDTLRRVILCRGIQHEIITTMPQIVFLLYKLLILSKSSLLPKMGLLRNSHNSHNAESIYQIF